MMPSMGAPGSLTASSRRGSHADEPVAVDDIAVLGDLDLVLLGARAWRGPRRRSARLIAAPDLGRHQPGDRGLAEGQDAVDLRLVVRVERRFDRRAILVAHGAQDRDLVVGRHEAEDAGGRGGIAGAEDVGGDGGMGRSQHGGGAPIVARLDDLAALRDVRRERSRPRSAGRTDRTASRRRSGPAARPSSMIVRSGTGTAVRTTSSASVPDIRFSCPPWLVKRPEKE